MHAPRILACLLFFFWIDAHVGFADSGSQGDTKESINEAWEDVENGAGKARNGLNKAWEKLDKGAQKAGKGARRELNEAWGKLTGTEDEKQTKEQP